MGAEIKKICNKCKEPKELNLFHSDKRNKDGKQATCIMCYNETRNKRYREDSEYRNKQKKRQNKYLKKANLRAKKHIKELSDFYLIKSLKRGTNLTTEEIKKHPELIEAKKQIILNKRLCQELKTSKT